MSFLGRLTFYFALLVIVLAILWNYLANNLQAVLLLDSLLDKLQDAEKFNYEKNRYLQHNYAPVSDESENIPVTIISGALPDGFSGIFLRLGPNPIPEYGFKKRIHWFDGHGMMHTLRFKDGKAEYSNKWLETERYKVERKLKASVFSNIGELFGVVGIVKAVLLMPLKQKLLGIPELLSGQANTAVNFIGDRLFANHEGSLPFEVQLDDSGHVSSLGFVSLNDVLDYPFTAHPKQVGDTLHFIGYGAQPGHAAMKYGAYSLARAAVTEYFDVPLSVIPFAHDFAATPHYVVLFESSIQFSTDGIMEGDFFQLKDKHSFRVGVLPVNNASAASIQWFNSSLALGVIHVLNAWEAGDEVVVAASLGDTFDGTLQEEEGSSAFVMTVLRMNRATGAMSMTAIDKSLLTEFPRVHPAYTGTFARYGYAGIQSAHSGNFIGIAKFDLETQTVDSTLLYDDGMVAGEVIPVPKLGAAGLASDGVYLATFIHNSRLNQSEWHLYDGEVMQREPVARLLIEGRRVPFGFHCEWISEDRLQRHLLHATAPHKHSS